MILSVMVSEEAVSRAILSDSWVSQEAVAQGILSDMRS